ncbi:hypothetical protein C7974DRAFT_77391 [Boeremia exigua]|uniref:uncharacterized protein n=1 Tax=Boeremia exigua TaxID=749465 RepID=UPI001E8E9318|nr:uncharacterized protein C7974DRAFT_77391 [Boeremia exigua]KAH6612380.1 hypothetical protein C7974DRAFT_77391 [Boeremia exigua]
MKWRLAPSRVRALDTQGRWPKLFLHDNTGLLYERVRSLTNPNRARSSKTHYRTRRWSPETWLLLVHANNAARLAQSCRDIADWVKIVGDEIRGRTCLSWCTTGCAHASSDDCLCWTM